MLKKMIVSSVVFAAVAMTTATTASAGKLGCINPADCRCELTSKEVDVEKSCFEVESKTICIPKVVFPWQTGHGCFGLGLFGCSKSACDSCDSADGCEASGCDTSVHNGAFTKTVKVLSKKKYTEPGCEYKWSVKEDGSCDEGCESAQAISQPSLQEPSIADRPLIQPLLNIAPVRVR